jgi:hypothetical protein
MQYWGIYDTVDHVWLGDDHGPKLFAVNAEEPSKAHIAARLAAEVFDKQLGNDPGRCQAQEFPEHLQLRLKDEQKIRMSSYQALRELEGDESDSDVEFNLQFDAAHNLWIIPGVTEAPSEIDGPGLSDKVQ